MIVTVYITHEKRLSILQNSTLHSTSNRTYQHSYAAVQLITDREPLVHHRVLVRCVRF